MKRSLTLICSLLLVFSSAACSTTGHDQQPAASPAPSSPVAAQSGAQTDTPGASSSVPAENVEPLDDIQNTTAVAKQPTSESTSTQQAQPTAPAPEEDLELERDTMQMNVRIKDAVFSATLEENAATKAFVELMKNEPVIIQMSDYSGFEKVGALKTSLPASNSQTTAQPGDIVLYNGNQIVIFYGSNSWRYTRLGRIDDLTGWTEALGNGDVTVTFSMK